MIPFEELLIYIKEIINPKTSTIPQNHIQLQNPEQMQQCRHEIEKT
jgi:hypothetical protein